MSEKTSRLAYLLGEMQRMMNGAVVGSMRFYGAEYGLNYGVSLSTVRSLAKSEAKNSDHKFAKLLYRQEVRELRLAALWIADSNAIAENNELDFWARGIINSEVAEEAAFALLYRCTGIESWLDIDNELLQYAALMAFAQRSSLHKEQTHEILNLVEDKVIELLATHQNLLPKGVVSLLDAALKSDISNERIETLLASLPENNRATTFIREEVAWRIEFR